MTEAVIRKGGEMAGVLASRIVELYPSLTEAAHNNDAWKITTVII